MFLPILHNGQLIKVVADFKALHYQVLLKLQKSSEPSNFFITRQLPLISCWAIVLFLFCLCVGSDTLIVKLWLLRLACAAWQCVWLLSKGIFNIRIHKFLLWHCCSILQVHNHNLVMFYKLLKLF